MKKVLFLSVVFVALVFASCKKDRTCSCKVTPVDGLTLTVDHVIEDSSRGDAKKECDDLDRDGGANVSCELK